MEPGEREQRYFEIRPEQLTVEALRGLIEEFVSRDGTDYGKSERSLEDKRVIVSRQLERGEVRIVFDRESEETNLVPARVWD